MKITKKIKDISSDTWTGIGIILICLAALFLFVGCSAPPLAPEAEHCESWQNVGQQIETSHQTTLTFQTGNCRIENGFLMLPKGRWLVQAQLTWGPSTSGLRGMCLITITGQVLAEAGTIPMTNGVVTIQMTTAVIESVGPDYAIRVTGTHTAGAPLRTWTGNDLAHFTYIRASRL